MKEMYDWYMEYMFGIHEKEARAYRKKQNRKADRRRDFVALSGSTDHVFSIDDVRNKIAHAHYVMFQKPGRSKWERIGKPILMNTFDQAIILNPFLPPKMRVASIARQIDEFMYRYDLSYNQ